MFRVNGLNGFLQISEDDISWKGGETLDNRDYQSVWRAVISQALIDIASCASNKKAAKDRRDALKWFMERDESFDTVCVLADVDPEYLRERATALMEDCKKREKQQLLENKKN